MKFAEFKETIRTEMVLNILEQGINFRGKEREIIELLREIEADWLISQGGMCASIGIAIHPKIRDVTRQVLERRKNSSRTNKK